MRAELDGPPLLLDGAMGSELIARGLPAGAGAELWVARQPEAVRAVHAAYVDAGSDIVLTCTFGGTAPRLATGPLAGQVAEVNRSAVRVARAAAGGRALVAGDLGPTGLMLAPMGTATEAELRAAFDEQVEALDGVDLFIVETMYDLREARAAVAAAAATGLQVFASLTFERKKRGFFSVVGDRVEPALRALHDAGAAAVGFNCALGSRDMVDLAAEAVAAAPCPVLAQPNAGQPRATVDGVVYDADPASFTADITAMVRGGVHIVGGCCGTTPVFVRAMRTALDSLRTTERA